LNVVYVSRQLGHANPSVTLGVYAHLFDRADHAATARGALDASYAATASGR
jgi:integrase